MKGIKLEVKLNGHCRDNRAHKKSSDTHYQIFADYSIFNGDKIIGGSSVRTFKVPINKKYHYVYLTLSMSNEYKIRLSNQAYSTGDILSKDIVVDFYFV